jgi:hypothetical protein
MSKKTSLMAMIAVVGLAVGASATVQDTVQIGYHTAYYMGNSTIRIPVHLYNDNQPLGGLAISFLYYCTGGPIVPDSITRAGRTAGTNIFDLYFDFAHVQGDSVTNPDSICAGFVSLQNKLPAGSGGIANMWFSGAEIGDLISFVPLPQVGPCQTDMEPYEPDGGLVFNSTHLVVTENALEISCGTSFTVSATHLLTFPVYVYSTAEPATLVIEDFYGPNMQFPVPTLSGSDPWQFRWQPAFQNQGEYTLVLRATDAASATTTETVTINVTPVTVDPCEVVRGDLNCDGIIDITDLLFLVDYMFNGGPPSDCQ